MVLRWVHAGGRIEPHFSRFHSTDGGLPGGDRTPDNLLRRQVLYPTELRADSGPDGAPDSTHIHPGARGAGGRSDLDEIADRLEVLDGPCAEQIERLRFRGPVGLVLGQRRGIDLFRGAQGAAAGHPVQGGGVGDEVLRDLDQPGLVANLEFVVGHGQPRSVMMLNSTVREEFTAGIVFGAG